MSHDNQRPSGHDSDGGEDFSIEGHDVAHEAAGTDDPYARAERQGWENQPTTLNDDFGDPESAAETAPTEDEDDAASAKSRGGLMLPLLLCVLVLGAGGFAYWQLVMKPGETASSPHQAEALAPAGEGQQQAAVALPTAVPPTPVVEAPVIPVTADSSVPSATPEAAMASGALSPAMGSGLNPAPVAAMAGSVPPSPVAASDTMAPATLPSPPAPDAALAPMPLVETAARTTLPTNGSDIVITTETPSIALNQKPPVVEMPPLPTTTLAPAETDSKSVKKALENDVVDLKQTVADLNDKLQKMKATAARQDAALMQAQAALKAAQAAAKLSAEKPAATAVATETHAKAKQQAHAAAHKTIVAHKKKPEIKKHAVTVAKSKKVAAKQSTASKTKPDNWALRSVAAGSAWIAAASAENDLKEVHVGDVVPGVGTIKSIALQDGHWVVEGSIRSLK